MIRQDSEKRHSRRIPIRLEAYILTDERTYSGHILNVSEDGFEYVVHTAVTDPDVFRYGKTIEFCFQIPAGEAINMLCTIRWLSKSHSDNASLTVGMKIAEPSPKFRYLLQPLDIVSIN